jgi:hypothetical protein
MRYWPESRALRRLLPAPRLLAPLLLASALVGVLALPALAPARETSAPDGGPQAFAAAKHRPQTKAAKRQRAKQRAQARKRPGLTLNSSFIHRAQALGTVLPFTLRLRRPYEGGPGDDVLQFGWDTASTPWPLAGTVPPSSPSTLHIDGAASYEWDYGADTSGYATLGTVETMLGGAISMTGSGFPIAVHDGSACATPALDATGVTFTSAGTRFGTLNPFSGQVSGTINLRTAIRSQVTPCSGTVTPDNALATTTGSDPPLPVAFTGTFTVSPGVGSDGTVRFGILRIDDAKIPQRTTFGLINACTDPSAADGCARMAFPVRTKLLSLTADVVAGDVMPAAPPNP